MACVTCGRRIWAVLLALGGTLLLTGCMISASVEELYALPRLPEQYQALSGMINEILAAGAEYTSPTSGTNLQSIQMEDLDGDGTEEALAFFRNPTAEQPLQIYIFRPVEDSYEQASVIAGSGVSIHSIQYVDMDKDGTKEILVSWRVSTEVQAVEIYTLENLEAVMLMSTAYARYKVVDLNGDGKLELITLRSDESSDASGTVGSVADYYDWGDGGLGLHSREKLSVSVAELLWMQAGALTDGEPALFITGRVTGAEGTASQAVTDILIYRQSQLSNIVLNRSTGVSSQIVGFLNLQPTDMNGDGATEVPVPDILPSVGEGEPPSQVCWHAFHADGSSQRQTITYHNQADGWYLSIPEEWDGQYTVSQSNVSSAEHISTFYQVENGQAATPLFSIYTLTGSNRKTLAERKGRDILRNLSSSDIIYAVSYFDSYASWPCRVEREELASRFSPIQAQWTTGEN